MQVIDLGGSLREVWQQISPNLFSVTLLRTTGEQHWEIRAHHVFSIRLPRVTEGENFHTYLGPRSGIDSEEAPNGDSEDGGSTPPGSTNNATRYVFYD